MAKCVFPHQHPSDMDTSLAPYIRGLRKLTNASVRNQCDILIFEPLVSMSQYLKHALRGQSRSHLMVWVELTKLKGSFLYWQPVQARYSGSFTSICCVRETMFISLGEIRGPHELG